MILDRKIIKKDGASKIILENPVISKDCTKQYKDHSWALEHEMIRKIRDKEIRKSQMESPKVQEAYFKTKIQDNPNQANSDLLLQFRKEFPETNFQMSSRSLTLIKQNLKKRNYDFKKNKELIDELVSSKGKNLLREKVNELNI